LSRCHRRRFIRVSHGVDDSRHLKDFDFAPERRHGEECNVVGEFRFGRKINVALVRIRVECVRVG